ncbi:MAG: hypothetical protein QOG41_1792 [Thermoleophilaceae bacterium]|nr:hypothetical protein [Thermoleophilaceae bacterium]
MLAPRTVLIAIAIAAVTPVTAANATWSGAGAGSHYVKAVSMPVGSMPTASVSNRSVTVSWTGSTMPGGSAIASYVVKRYDTIGNVQTIGSGCSGTISALTCTETAVPGGTWKYSVAPTLGNWTGAEGAQSASVTVAGPSLSFSSSTTVTSLPTTLSGTVAGFVGGQTLTYRLDDPSTGTVLSGTLSPTPIPTAGGSSVTVTIPAGTPNGAHTVYAVGSGGTDVASKPITVAVPYTSTFSAWDLRDASSAVESNQSAQTAFAADARTLTTGNWPSAFNTANYFEFNMDAPLPAAFAVSGAAFNFTYAAGAAGDTACYWFEVRRASTGAVIVGGTHGSSAAPVDCVTGTTLKSVTTTLSELNTSDLADDARVRVYARESGLRPLTIDRATVTGSTPATSFTLYANSTTDASTGTATTSQWSLFAAGGLTYTTASSWANAFSTTRYLTMTFPSYIPSAATVTGVTLTHSFRPSVAGKTACYYLEVYSGATLVASRGSSGASYSCNGTTTYKTDVISLTEINTPAEANGAIVKMYFNETGNGSRTTDHDVATLVINHQ